MRSLRKDGGVATVEMAFLLPILLLLSVVAVEFGFAFVDWSAVSNATRTGARVAAAAGDEPNSDNDVLIPAIVEAMIDAPRSEITTIEIFRVNPDGTEGPLNRYTEISGSWSCAPCGYPESVRNTSLTNPDTIAVRINFTHDWVVDFWSATNPSWSDSETVRLEPDFLGT